jgi:Tfp pilus assembly protein PilV
MINFRKSYGFALVELMVACSIIVIAIFSLISATQKGVVLSERAMRQTQASYLLEEGAEAVKSIRDSAWTNISSLTSGTNYYLSYNNSTNVWSLSTTAITIDNIFTRTVVISDVSRDSNDDIATSGTNDPKIKLVTISISWVSSGETVSKSMAFYIADIFN